MSAATAAGRWARPETSWTLWLASRSAFKPLASSAPMIRTVRVSVGAGSTLSVTSVITASVPYEPASTLHKS